MRRTTTFALVTVLLSSLLLVACGEPPPSFRGNVLDSPVLAPDFVLTDQHGESFRLSEQRGRVVVLFFGYASCPDVCPTTLGVWKRVYVELGADAEKVRFVFVTVDPERDTQERLREHLALFSPDFVGLTGTLEELESVYQAYGVYREKEALPGSELGYQVTHTASAYVIDPDGYWRLRHLFGTPAEDIVHDIRRLLK
jgi:protein SCO1/2